MARRFADGETVKTFTLPIALDDMVEGIETVQLGLLNPTGGALVGNPGQMSLTILDRNLGVLIPSGSALVVESGPVNGIIDPSETVTMLFAPRNVGVVNTTNLVGIMLAMFVVLDSVNFRRAPRAVRELETTSEEWKFAGLHNVWFLAMVLGAVFIQRPPFVRELVMLLAAGCLLLHPLVKLKKEVEGGNDGVAQVRSDYPEGVKLGKLNDGTIILVPDVAKLTAEEKSRYVLSDGVWTQCWNSSGGLFFPNPSKPTENWFETKNNTRDCNRTAPAWGYCRDL